MFGDCWWSRFPLKKITGRFTAQAIQAENQRRQVRICTRISGRWLDRSHGGFGATLEESLKLTYHVDGSEIRRSPVEVGIFSHSLQGFIRTRLCRISEPSTAPENRWLEDFPFGMPSFEGCLD